MARRGWIWSSDIWIMEGLPERNRPSSTGGEEGGCTVTWREGADLGKSQHNRPWGASARCAEETKRPGWLEWEEWGHSGMRGGQRGDRVGSQIMWGLEGPYRGSGSDGQHERLRREVMICVWIGSFWLLCWKQPEEVGTRVEAGKRMSPLKWWRSLGQGVRDTVREERLVPNSRSRKSQSDVRERKEVRLSPRGQTKKWEEQRWHLQNWKICLREQDLKVKSSVWDV